MNANTIQVIMYVTIIAVGAMAEVSTRRENVVMKCEMCDCHTSKTVKIKNRKNGKELNICRGCAVQNGFMAKPSGTHWECKYCDCTRGVPYEDEPDFLVCAQCGAEWEDCKILVDDEEY